MVRTGKGDMPLPLLGPRGMRAVGMKPAPFGRTAGGACPRGSQSSERAGGGASLRGGGDARGILLRKDCGFRRAKGRIPGDEEVGVRTERGVYGALWRIRCSF